MSPAGNLIVGDHLVLYQGSTLVWSSGTAGQNCGTRQCRAVFQADGNFVVYKTTAVRKNRFEILELLLNSGFDPDERVSSREGDWIAYSQGYPLWHAAALGRYDMAKLARTQTYMSTPEDRPCTARTVMSSGRWLTSCERKEEL